MSTNHNRIKVADLETNEQNKILTTNTDGELEFTDINNIKIDSYNALDYSIAGKALDARQGKILKDLIDNINALLASDNVNLDTVQELVNAIETVQTSLSTILVNDVTTGGVTKALTAEMGKTLKMLYDSLSINKVDKVAGERLINTVEITKLAGLGNLTTTVKPILSTVLATQNAAGLVTYINALTPVLVVGPNETVTYKTTNTGRVFELLLRGRSFGVGQPAIVAADVVEITEFLNKDITLSNYPGTRNDGQLPNNKVLSTDANGNLKLYTIALAQAPFISELIPDSNWPSTTGNIELTGEFFIPAMCLSANLNSGNGIQITGQTINFATFVNSQKILLNVTNGATEGSFSITCNNGLSTTKNDVLLIVLGTVFKPTTSEWILTEPVNVDNDNVYTQTYNSIGYAEWTKQFDFTKNFSVRFKRNLTPLGAYQNRQGVALFILQKVSNSSNLFWSGFAGGCSFNSVAGGLGNYTTDNGSIYEYRWVSGIMYVYVNNILFGTFSGALLTTFSENLKLKIRVDVYDIKSIKYIELAT